MRPGEMLLSGAHWLCLWRSAARRTVCISGRLTNSAASVCCCCCCCSHWEILDQRRPPECAVQESRRPRRHNIWKVVLSLAVESAGPSHH